MISSTAKKVMMRYLSNIKAAANISTQAALTQLPKHVRIVEVGPRDGLQNEKSLVPAEVKAQLINHLVDSGIKHIEVTSFVSPKWVPQMGDNSEVCDLISRQTGVTYSALTPNIKGYNAAVSSNMNEVAIFAAASESFSKKNINCTIEESLERFEAVCEAAKKDKIPVRGYVSCVVACPYEGKIDFTQVAHVARYVR